MDMQWIDRVLDTEYATREEALKVTEIVERETLGVGIRRHGDGYCLEELQYYWLDCHIHLDDSRPVEEFVDLEGAPDAYRVVSPADEGGFDRLAPVIEFLDGDIDGVDIYSTAPTVEPVDYLSRYVTNRLGRIWTVLCADRAGGEAA